MIYGDYLEALTGEFDIDVDIKVLSKILMLHAFFNSVHLHILSLIRY